MQAYLLSCCLCNLLPKQQLQIHYFQLPLAAPGGLAPDPGFAFGNGRERRHGLPREPPRTGIPVFLISHFGEAAVLGRLLRLGKRGARWSQRREHPVAPLSGKGCDPEKRMPLCIVHLLVSTSCQTGGWFFLRTSPQVGRLDCPGFFRRMASEHPREVSRPRFKWRCTRSISSCRQLWKEPFKQINTTLVRAAG